MKESGKSKMICFLCMVIFLHGLSLLPQAGVKVLFPIYAYGGRDEVIIWENFLKTQMQYFFPVFVYSEEEVIKKTREDVFEIREVEQGEMLTLMELENNSQAYISVDSEQMNMGGSEIILEDGQIMKTESGKKTDLNEQERKNSKGVPDKLEEETDIQSKFTDGFIKHERISPIDLKELEDYETLVKRFYTIDAITTIGADELSARELGSVDLTMKSDSKAPQILIYHTHSQEGYVDSVPGDDSTTIMGVGEHLKEILEKQYGYNVLHHMGKYDVKTRDNAYSKSLPEIQKILADNPSIEVVIDLHRDGVANESTKLVMDLDGRPTAQFMFFNGISRTKKTGKIDYLHNENLKTNLALSFQMKWKAEEYYPGLTRKNYLNAYRYNMHVCPKTMLLELGAQTNTLEEAMNACDPIAHILHIVLSGE